MNSESVTQSENSPAAEIQSRSAAKRRELFSKVGRRAAVLSKAIARGEGCVDVFIEEQLGFAEEDVLGLTTYGSPHVDRAEGDPDPLTAALSLIFFVFCNCYCFHRLADW